MRLQALFAALLLIGAPLAAVTPAFADGIERPAPPRRAHRPQPHRHVVPAPAPIPVAPPAVGPETVTLSQSFFSGGGVGTDIGTGFVGGGGRTVIGGATAVAIAFSSSSARAGVGGHFSGHSGGGHGGGCGCH